MPTPGELATALLIILTAVYGILLYRERDSVEPDVLRVVVYSAIAFFVSFLLHCFARESVGGYCTSMTLGYASLFVFAVIWGKFTGYAAGLGVGLASALLHSSHETLVTIGTAVAAGALVGWLAENHRETSVVIIASIAGGALIFTCEAVSLWLSGTNPVHCLEPLAVSLVTGVLAASSASYARSSRL